MSVTPKKLTANRANAKKSTGPRTAAGKRRSSKNAVTHGIFCNDLVLPGEDAKLFESFRHAVLLKLSPQDIVELMIVDRIVIAQWKLRRLNAVEASAHVGIAQDRIKGAREELNHERVEKFGTDEPDASHQMQQQLLEAEERDPDVINHLAVSFIRTSRSWSGSRVTSSDWSCRSTATSGSWRNCENKPNATEPITPNHHTGAVRTCRATSTSRRSS
jgi:hypothetical protein